MTLVETVGVGQTEHEVLFLERDDTYFLHHLKGFSKKVEALVDTMLLLLAPGAGDGLQGMKRGLTELADIVGKDDWALREDDLSDFVRVKL